MLSYLFFFFNDPATTEIYTLSLHDALPICPAGDRLDDDDAHDRRARRRRGRGRRAGTDRQPGRPGLPGLRSEEHTSELQSRRDLVCRLLLEKKKKNKKNKLI